MMMSSYDNNMMMMKNFVGIYLYDLFKTPVNFDCYL